jgi:urease accessory protein
MAMAETVATPGLYRLLAWTSPSFPTGAFSYSHGLEAFVADGTVRDRASLQAWIAAVVTQGSGRIDADILRDAHRAAAAGDLAALDAANRRGVAYRATAELALESGQQGEAFLATCRAAWPDAFIAASASPHPNPPPQAGEGTCGRFHPPPLAGEGRVGAFECGEDRIGISHSVVFGAVAARAGIALADALTAYLHAFAGNLVSAGIRLGVLGQTDGQRILAALEPVVTEAARASLTRDSADFGAASFAVDLASMAHETQYSRLFRS